MNLISKLGHWIKDSAMPEPKILKLAFLSDYVLKLQFDSGEIKAFDVKPYIKGTWGSELQDISYFKQARISEDMTFVEWPNGQDICPDNLYESSQHISDGAVPPFSHYSAIDAPVAR
jgi:hypothetical protein